MKETYKNKIIQLLDSIDDEKHLRYIYILVLQMITKKTNVGESR